ncbi:MAG: ThuA domain-containing protein [Verrucomicrobiales bacterium]
MNLPFFSPESVRFAFGAATLLGLSVAASAQDAEARIQVLIVDGQNNHDWEATTPVLAGIYEASDRFEVTVSTTPPAPPRAPRQSGEKTPEADKRFAEALRKWKADVAEIKKKAQSAWDEWRPDFAAYDVVVSNYNGELWPEPVRESFEAYVRDGGGFVPVHAANNAFPEWKEYNRMIGLGGWGGRSELSGPYLRLRDGEWTRDTSAGKGGSHGKRHEFVVVAQAEDHPIMDGLPKEWMHAEDELYDRLRGPAENVTVLAAAFSDEETGGSGETEPLLMTVRYGDGRVFHTALGHDTVSMSGVGFQETLKRGTEWAATGEVTFPDVSPDELPADRVFARDKELVGK